MVPVTISACFSHLFGDSQKEHFRVGSKREFRLVTSVQKLVVCIIHENYVIDFIPVTCLIIFRTV